jgi:hypothetical protein
VTTLSVVATPQPSNLPPRVQVTVTDTGTSPAITAATVTRTDNSGRTTIVRTTDGGPLPLVTSGSNRVGTVYDYEAPYGVPVTYSTSEQPANTSGAVTLSATKVWLVHVGIPDRSVPITVAEFGNRSRQVARGVFYPMGRSTPVVITDGSRKSYEGSLTLLTLTDAERVAIDDLISDAGVLLMNVPADRGWGVDTQYVSLGDSQEERVVNFAGQPARRWRLPYVVVDAPVGGTQAQYTWADVITTYATWQDVISANATWAAVQAPTS